MNEIEEKVKYCKICGASTNLIEDKEIRVTYSFCNQCGFIYKNIDHHLNPELELEEYKNHNNSFESKGYVSMFKNLIDDFITPLHVSGKALDFGSGPGPVLKELLQRAGFEAYDYDPFFNPNKQYLSHKYNLITVTEVVEHFFTPLEEFKHIKSLLNKDGYLVLMTKLNPSSIDEFLKSSYRREKTHVSFYALETIQYLSKRFHLKMIKHNDKNIILLRNVTNKI